MTFWECDVRTYYMLGWWSCDIWSLHVTCWECHMTFVHGLTLLQGEVGVVVDVEEVVLVVVWLLPRKVPSRTSKEPK